MAARRELTIGENFLAQKERHLSARADYNAAKISPYRRLRTGTLAQGSHADWHYRVPTDFWRIMEQARAFDRDDQLAGTMLDKTVDNVLLGGITPHPTTGDPGLDRALLDRWQDWSGDEDQVDVEGEMDFHECERQVFRNSMVDGDCFAAIVQGGSLRKYEAHRARTPTNALSKNAAQRNIIHGVLLDNDRRRLQAWFTREDIQIWSSVERISDMIPVDFRDEDDFRQLCHVRDSKRFTQTRGVSVFAQIFDPLGMHEDIQFATLVKQQVSACFAFLRQRGPSWVGTDGEPLGDVRDGQPAYRGQRARESVAPGMEKTSEKDEKIEGFSPAIPSSEAMEHLKRVIQIIGVNIGLPLMVALLDASEGNFSNYRAVMDQARLGFRRHQRRLIRQFHRPVYRYMVREWLEKDPDIRPRSLKSGVSPFRHRWNLPAFPYIDPLKDAQTDAFRLGNVLTSPRRLHAERNQDIGDIQAETIDDRASGIEMALKRAAKINAKYPEARITFRDLLPMALPAGVKVDVAAQQDDSADEDTAPKPAANKGKPRQAQRVPSRQED